MTIAKRAPSYARVLADVFVLRQAIQFSELDSDLKNSGVPLSYFVDPSLIELYVEPAKWAHRLAAFPSLYTDSEEAMRIGKDSWADINALRATALLTGEYIFSRTLVGPLGDLYVTPDHFTELLGYISKVEREHFPAVRQFERQISQAPEIADEIVKRIRSARALQKAGLRRSTGVEAWREALVETLGTMTTDNLVVTRRLNDLLGDRLLATAAVLDEFTIDVVAPRQARVNDWIHLIRRAKHRNQTKSTPSAIEADAVTLEQLWLLNAASGAARFVLITDDAGLHSAYQAMCRRSANAEATKRAEDPTYETVEPFYALRRSIQFTPILNLTDMGGAFESKGLFQKIQSGVDYIAQTFTSSDEPEDADRIVDYLAQALDTVTSADARLNATLMAMAEDIRNDWKKLVHYASSAKTDVLAQRALEDETYWTQFVQSPRFRAKFSEAADSFREEAVTLSASSTLLRQEVWALKTADETGASLGDDYSRRALASDFTAFESRSLMGRTLSSVVQDWMVSGAKALDTLQEIEVRGERLLCVGALCLQIGAWGAAHRLLQEAVESLHASGGRPAEEEALFFYAMAARLAATDRSWRKRRAQAENAIARLRRTPRQRQDPFARARLGSEEIAVALCQLPWHHAELDRQQTTIILQQAETSALGFAARHLDFLLDNRAAPANLAVLKQICLNVFCLTAWRALHDGAVSSPVQQLYARYEDLYRQDWMQAFTSGPHADTYPLLAQVATAQDGEERRTAARLATRRIDNRLKRDVEHSFALDMPVVDKREFRQLRAWVQGYIQSGSTLQPA